MSFFKVLFDSVSEEVSYLRNVHQTQCLQQIKDNVLVLTYRNMVAKWMILFMKLPSCMQSDPDNCYEVDLNSVIRSFLDGVKNTVTHVERFQLQYLYQQGLLFQKVTATYIIDFLDRKGRCAQT
jgi:hypothetical protein